MTVVESQRPTTLPDPDSGRAGWRHQIASEWTKERTVRSTWICLAIIVVASLGLSALITNVEAGRWAHLQLVDRAQFDPVRSSLAGAFIGQFVVGVLGALAITSEYGSGMIRTTLAAASRRSSVLAAKLTVVGIVVLVVGEVTAFASFFLGQLVLLGHGAKVLPQGSTIADQVRSATIPVVPITSPGVLRAVVLGGLYLVLLALLGCAIGFIIRNTAGAISLFVGILLLLPLIVNILPSSISNSFEKYLPSNLGLALSAVTTRKTDFAGVLLTPWSALGLLVLYVVLVSGLALWLLERRDA